MLTHACVNQLAHAASLRLQPALPAAMRCSAKAANVSTNPAHHKGERRPARLSGVSDDTRPETLRMIGQRKQAKPATASAIER